MTLARRLAGPSGVGQPRGCVEAGRATLLTMRTGSQHMAGGEPARTFGRREGAMTDLDEAIAAIQASALSDADKGRVSRLLTLLDKSSAVMDARELRQAREVAGLSVAQAAKLLGVSRLDVELMENNGNPCTGTATIDAVYGLGPREARTRFA